MTQKNSLEQTPSAQTTWVVISGSDRIPFDGTQGVAAHSVVEHTETGERFVTKNRYVPNPSKTNTVLELQDAGLNR